MTTNITKRALSLLVALLITLGTLPIVTASAEELYLCEVTDMKAEYDPDAETMTYSGTYSGELQTTRTYVFFLNDSEGNITISNVPGSTLDLGDGRFGYSFHLSAAEIAEAVDLTVELTCGANNVIKPITVPVTYAGEVASYTLTFVATEGGSLVGETVLTVDEGTALSTLTYPTPVANAGYVFDGWTYTEGIVDGDMTLKASFAKDESLWTRVTFSCGVGGVLDGESVFDILVGTAFDDITVPTPTANEGYAFVGWDKAFPDTVTEPLSFKASFEYVGDVPVSLDIISAIYCDGYVTVKGGAILLADQWDIAFRVVDADTGSTVAMNTVKYSAIKTDGGYEYSFKVNPADIKDNTYVSVKLVNVPLASVEKTIGVIYYTVTFVDHDGTVLDAQTVKHGATATAPTAPEKTGYHFVSWDKPLDNVTEDMTVTALYEINVYTVTFVDANRNEIDKQSVEHGATATAPTAPEKTGYHFVSWDKSFDNVTEDMTVTALYEINVYTVTFVDADGNEIDKQTVEHGATATAPTAPARENCVFAGWDGDYTNITKNTIFTALYVPASYTISFETVGGGKIVGNTSVDVALGTDFSNVPLPEIAADDGYVFAGWVIPQGAVTEAATLTARFVLLGDVNGDGNVDNLDSAYILRHDAGKNTLTGDALIAADADRNGTVNSLDAAIILRLDAGLISKL